MSAAPLEPEGKSTFDVVVTEPGPLYVRLRKLKSRSCPHIHAYDVPKPAAAAAAAVDATDATDADADAANATDATTPPAPPPGGGPVEATGLTKVGDLLVAVDEVSLVGLTFRESVQVIQRSTRPTRLARPRRPRGRL